MVSFTLWRKVKGFWAGLGPLGKEAIAQKIEIPNSGGWEDVLWRKSLEDYLGCLCFIRFLLYWHVKW